MRREPSGTGFPCRKGMAHVLAISFLLGILCGLAAFAFADAVSVSLMRRVLNAPVSIVGIFCAVLFPFLLSAFLAFLYGPGWVCVVCFCEAFLYAYVSLGLLMCFQNCGWLLRCFLLFGDCTMPVLYWFWMRCLLRHQGISQFFSAVVTGITLLAAAGLEYFCVAPFFGRILESMKG